MSSSAKQTTDSTQSSTTNPWDVQTPYLTQAFSGASNALGQAQSNAVIPSEFTAQFTPSQISAFQQMQNTGMNNNQIPASSANAGASTSGAGAAGVNSGLYGLMNYTNQGGTQSNINAAEAYAGNQPIGAMTKAAMQPAIDTANYLTNPAIDSSSAADGNINSSRNAIQHGLVTKGLQTDASNVAANLTGQAYNSGLSLAEQNSESNNSNTLSSLMGQLSGGTSAVNAGTAANSGAVSQQGGLYDIATGGIAGQNAAAQAADTNAQQAFTANTNDPFAALRNYYGIVGANNWGGSTTGSGTSTTTSTPSIWSTVGGLMTAGGSLMMSDEREKRDILPVGKLNDGQKIYRYRYKDSPTWYVGLLAQEVEKIHPEAVREIFGVKHVNYDLATRASL